VERYCKEQGIFRGEGAAQPDYAAVLDLDLGSVETSIAGPKRPQDRIPLSRAKSSWREVSAAIKDDGKRLQSRWATGGKRSATARW